MRTYQARGLPSKIIAWIIMIAMCIGLIPLHIDTAYAATNAKPRITFIELRDNGTVKVYGTEASSGAKITHYGISKKFGSDGSFEFKPDGGDEPYRWQTSNTFTNLTSAAYNFWVKDANGVMSESFEFLVFRQSDITSNNGVSISAVYDGSSTNPCKVPIGQKVDVSGYYSYGVNFTVSWPSSTTTSTFQVKGNYNVNVNTGMDILGAYDNTKAGTVKIKATLLGQSDYVDVQFYNTPMQITPQNYVKDYWRGEAFKEQGTALITWADGKTETVPLKDVLWSFDTSRVGNNQPQDLYYIGKDSSGKVVGTVESTFNINVKARPTVTSRTVANATTQYYIGDTFDNKGTLNIVYSDGTSENVALSKCTVSNFSTTSASAGKNIAIQYTPTKAGYEGGVVIATHQIKVYHKPITMTVKTVGATQADKTYDVARTTQSTVSWTLPTPDTIPGKTFKGYSTSSTGTDLKNSGTTVTANANSTYYAVYEDTPVLTSISVSGAKTDYNVGDTFVEQGNVVKNYSSGPAQTTPLKESMISGFDTSTAGTKPVTVSLESKTTTYDINVVDSNKAPYIIADQCEHELSHDGRIKVVAADDDGRVVEYGYSPITIFPSTDCDASHATWQTSDTFILPSGAYWFYVKDDKGAISERVRLRSLPYSTITGLNQGDFEAPRKLDYTVGETIDTTGGCFRGVWDDHGKINEDGSLAAHDNYWWSIPLEHDMLEPYDNTQPGTVTITAHPYNDKFTGTFEVTFKADNQAPYIIADQCIDGVSENGTIKVAAADDDGSIVAYGYSPVMIRPRECDSSDATWQTSDTFTLPSGEYYFYAKDDKGATSEPVRLKSLPLTSIRGFQNAGKLGNGFDAPDKVRYIVGENIDPTGGMFYLTWDNHGDVYENGALYNGYGQLLGQLPLTHDMIRPYNNTTVGGKQVHAYPHYTKDTDTHAGFQVYYTDPAASIAVLNPKTAYNLNDTFTEQGTVEVTYTSGSTASVPLTEDLISGFDTSTTGMKPITVTYEGKTASYTITVSDTSTTNPGDGSGDGNDDNTDSTPGTIKHTITLLTGNLFTGKFEDKERYTMDEGDDFEFPEPDDSSRKFLGYTPTMSMIWHDGIDTYMPGETITVDENKTFYRLYNQAPFLKYIDQDGYGTVTMVADDIDGTIDEYGYAQSGGVSSVDNWQADNEFSGLENGSYTFYAKDNQGATVKAEVDVILKDDGITFSSFDTPDKVDYLIGEDLDLTGSGFWFNMPEESDIPTGFVSTAPSMLSDYDNTVEGTVSITATCFDEYTGDFDVTFSNAVVSIEVIDAQTEYNVGDEFVEQGTVILTYADGTTDELPLTEDLVSGFDTSEPGNSLLEVTYTDPISGDIVDNVPITITDNGNNDDKEIDYIEVSDVTMEYEQDDPFDGRGTITIHYTDGTEETKPLDESLLEGFDTSEPGTITVTVKVDNSETYFDIEVSEPTPDNEIDFIEVSGVTTEYNKGSLFDGQGIVVIHYTDGTIDEKPIAQDMLNGFDTSKPGTIQVTVTTDGKSTDYTITVKDNNTGDGNTGDGNDGSEDSGTTNPEAPKPTTITLNGMQTNYYVGDSINLAGSTAIITYDNGTTKEVPITADMVTGFNTTTAGIKQLVITLDGVDATHTIVVTSNSNNSNRPSGGGGSGSGGSGSNHKKPSTSTGEQTEIRDEKTPLIEAPDTLTKDDAPGKDVYGQQFKLKSGVHVANGLENGYIAGYKDKTFKPTNSITRAEFAAILYRVFNFDNQTITCDFEDVPDGIWYEQAVGVLASRNVIYGVGGNKFAPQQNITVEQALLMLGRIVDVSKYNGVSVEGNTDLVLANVKKVINSGIAKGFEGLDLKSNITREQAVTFINNIIYSSLDTSKVNQFTDINESMKTERDIVKASLVKEGDVGYTPPTPQIAQIAPVAEIEPAQQENAQEAA